MAAPSPSRTRPRVTRDSGKAESERPCAPASRRRASGYDGRENRARESGSATLSRAKRVPECCHPDGVERSSLNPRDGAIFGHAPFWTRNFGHARKFAQLEGGLLPQETVGGQIRPREHRNAQHGTNIGPRPSQPRPRIPRAVSTTTPEGKEANCRGQLRTREPPCPRISVRVKFLQISEILSSSPTATEAGKSATSHLRQRVAV